MTNLNFRQLGEVVVDKLSRCKERKVLPTNYNINVSDIYSCKLIFRLI